MRAPIIKDLVMYRTALILGALIFSLCGMPSSADDYISPDLIRVSTPIYHSSAGNFEPALGTYEYSVGWEGIPAASATVTIDEENGHYKVTAAARTLSAIDIFYKLRYTAVSSIDGLNLAPNKLHIIHDENSKHKEIVIDYDKNGFVHASRTQQNGADDKRLDFLPHNMMLEPISAAFLARAVDWKVGDTKVFDVFNGKSRYLISLNALDKKFITHQGQNREVFVISPRVRTLTTTKANEKLREAKIYLTTDKTRDILKIESSVFIGTVDTELESFIPSEKRETFTDLRMARLKESAMTAN